MSTYRSGLPVSRGTLLVSVGGTAVLLFYKASKQYYPELFGYWPIVAAIAVLAIALILYVDKNAFTQALSDRAAALITNFVVVLLIGTITLGYFLIAQKYRFDARLTGVFLGTSFGALLAGWLLRKKFSRATWLAYGITFIVGIFAAVLVWATLFPRLK